MRPLLLPAPLTIQTEIFVQPGLQMLQVRNTLLRVSRVDFIGEIHPPHTTVKSQNCYFTFMCNYNPICTSHFHKFLVSVFEDALSGFSDSEHRLCALLLLLQGFSSFHLFPFLPSLWQFQTSFLLFYLIKTGQ